MQATIQTPLISIDIAVLGILVDRASTAPEVQFLARILDPQSSPLPLHLIYSSIEKLLGCGLLEQVGDKWYRVPVSQMTTVRQLTRGF